MSNADTTSESNKSYQNSSSSGGIVAKIRRFKIEEDLIIQNIKKNFCEVDNGFIMSDLEFKKYLTRLKTYFADIKHLFEDLKSVTKTHDTLQQSEIDDIKKDVLQLDEKIKCFKSFIISELAILKSNDQDLVTQMNQEEIQNAMAKRHPKIQTKSYSDIIPSPVGNIINSPFKYPEVQQFQDFLSQSNKHGGWNEYHHNIFIKLWQKHFQTYEDFFSDEAFDQADEEMFIAEVTESVSGVTKADIISHMKWYTKYLYLKNRQQCAIEKWRSKTKSKKVYPKDVSKTSNVQLKHDPKMSSPQTGRFRKCSALKSKQLNQESSPINFSAPYQNYSSLADMSVYLKEMERSFNLPTQSEMKNEQTGFRYTRATKQWNNRCNSLDDVRFSCSDLNKITKLGIPNWRSKLTNIK